MTSHLYANKDDVASDDSKRVNQTPDPHDRVSLSVVQYIELKDRRLNGLQIANGFLQDRLRALG